MAFVSYAPDAEIPGSGTAYDENGRRFTVIEADVPDVKKLPRPSAPGAAPAASNMPGAAPAAKAAPAASRVDQLVNAVSAVTHPASAPAGNVVKTGSQTTTAYGAPKAALDTYAKNTGEAANALADQAEKSGQEKTERQQQAVQAHSSAIVGNFYEDRAQQAELQRQKAENDAALDALRKETDPPPDPNQFVDSLSAGTKIGLVVAAAVQGAFRGLAHQDNNGPDSVVNILNRRIAESIDAQKEQIASGRIRRGNLIAGLMDKGYDLKTAISAATARIQNAAAAMAEQQSAMIGTPEAAEQGKTLAQQIRANAQQNIDNAVLANAPRSTSTTTYATTTGKPGGDLEGFQKFMAARKAYEESGASKGELEKFDKAMGFATPSGESETARTRREAGEKRSEDQGKAASALAGLKAYGEAIPGVKRDPDTGKLVGDNSVLDYVSAPGQRENVKSFYTAGKADTPLANRRAAAEESLGRLQSGGVISADEAARFKGMLGGAGATPSQIADALNSIEAIVEPRLAAADRTGTNRTAEQAGFKAVK